jgi:hypothetical protein
MEYACKEYGMLPPRIAESDTISLSHDLCVSGESIYNKDTIQNTLSSNLLALKMIDPEIAYKLV